MLEMRNVSKRYRTSTVETRALAELNLSVEEGEFVAIVGPSGSGKTTFLNVAGLLESFDGGSYDLDGEDVSQLNDKQRSQVRNQKIGFIFQNFNLIPDLNIFDNVDIPLRYQRVPSWKRSELVESALDTVGLKGRMKHLPGQLSGGQQQRVAIARALVGSPRLLLADEPTGNLDSNTANGVFDLLLELHNAGSTILMVTHEESMASHASRSVQIRDGILRAN
ncbi:MAG: ABC transporter ATP-binding protein [Gammaproteobacteria bacterium]|nr:ABC transporter ATP-binding protein [Gammaproteobacteria bacterium]MYD80017.1 ABC transporter ATP-binding protein [Gammaproteobacteria bacterium]